MYRDLVYRPGSDSIAVETLPYDLSTDDSKIEALGQAFLNAFIGGPGSDVARYVPFVPVAPGDIDPGGSEPGPEAAMADYVRRQRERGVFDRVRQRLIEKGFPLGGV